MGTYNVLFYGGLILAILFLIATVVLFFVLKIPKVFGDLTGRTERKSIEEIRKTGYESKSKQEAIREETSRITVRDAENDPETGNLKRKNIERKAALDAKLSSKESEIKASLEDETEVLGAEKHESEYGEQTEILETGSDNETTDILKQYPSEEEESDTTDILTSEDDGGTTDILTSDDDDSTTDRSTPEDEGDTTDILTSEDEEADRTDVLTAENESDITDILIPEKDEAAGTKESIPMDIIGRYSAEETAVLRNIHDTPEEDKNTVAGIQYIYNVTVVHTSEAL